MSKDIQVYVISHSAEDIKNIKSNEIYTPLFVGRNGQDNLGFVSDDTGENISSKNSSYCELTGLYWMWKNSPADILQIGDLDIAWKKRIWKRYLILMT